ncbi:MAG: histidine--tRNA ligase [Acidimicrobiaceae bacterium TMED77]|nr:histidine--tRNA ligase [Acidimicrobiales bacterium]OUU99814.1 MAG: histidine--tRNA ligase [Acidimicrobiaceae bacterium TMED77]|tara:strand:+ start:11237 stop:12511 length:1275 start_codon:yes stop_codon:yes gene_type:complete
MGKSHFQSPRGTRDILPPESDSIRFLLKSFEESLSKAGYGQIISPLFEDVGVFKRIGESTEIVTKEMFDFFDKDEKSPQHLALRPELTASICRAFAQHRPVAPWKVWYSGPQFRYEKPQAGRYRQFLQVGAEILGTSDPEADVEIVALAETFFRDIGLGNTKLLINSLGDLESRNKYNEQLVSYLNSQKQNLSEQSLATLEKNALRVLDSKREEDQEIIKNAPTMESFLNQESADHFSEVKKGLTALDIAFEVSPRLVRGLDYYTRTTFEFVSQSLDTAQNAIGGGGRYDGLVEALGGPPTEGIGFAIGIDRTLLACAAEHIKFDANTGVDVFVVDTTEGQEALLLAHELRKAGIRTDRSFGGRSMKGQMKAADRSGAQYAIIIGTDELEKNQVTLRDLRGDGNQKLVPREMVAQNLQTILQES